jgi:hypothetical protein
MLVNIKNLGCTDERLLVQPPIFENPAFVGLANFEVPIKEKNILNYLTKKVNEYLKDFLNEKKEMKVYSVLIQSVNQEETINCTVRLYIK